MPALWSGALADLQILSQGGYLTDLLAAACRQWFGPPSLGELKAWDISIPKICDNLNESRFDEVQAVVELQMPVGAERADLVLLGGDASKPHGYLFELKQWSECELDPEACEVDVAGLGMHQHPVAQVLNYQGKLSLFNERAHNYDWAAGAYMHNLSPGGLAQLVEECDDALPRTVQLFGPRDGEALAHSVSTHLLPTTISGEEHSQLVGAAYKQSAMLFDVLAEHADDIANRAVATLAEAGVYLMEDQELVVEQVLKGARMKTEEVFLVEGGPGSGKTLVAVHLLLRAIREGLRCVLALRNNRLQAILKKCFDIAFPGASGVLMYFEVPQFGTGIGDQRFSGTFDLVICDEAQRMRAPSMERVLSRAPTSVIFLDESQRLNPPEQGTHLNFSAAATSLKKSVSTARLPAGIRCRGGQPYHDFVDKVLDDPFRIRTAEHEAWRGHYDFRVLPSIDSMLQALVSVKKADPSRQVALVAAFTESPGSISRQTDPENIRIGYPLISGWDLYKDLGIEVRWLMKPSEYVGFWMKRRSDVLDMCASIYGAQGFEADYVGVIWGRDLVIDNNRWELGDPEHCYDTIDRLVIRPRGGEARWSKDALELVKNRYRIFLTRGIHGTFVFLENRRDGKLLGSTPKDSA